MNNPQNSITKAAGTMSLATTASRLLGLVRDQASAYFFGAGWVSDAFVIAFRIPNLLRDLLAEGALSAAFVPAMTKERQQRGHEGALRLASLMMSSLAILMAAMLLLGLAFSPQLVAGLAGGFQDRPEQFDLTVRLTRILFPFLSLMVFSSLLMGILISRSHFVTGAVAPIFLNLTILLFGAALYFQGGMPPERKVLVWAWGCLAGGLVQLLVHVPPVLKEGFRWKPSWPFRDKGVAKIWGQMGPAILGQSGNQLNLWVNSWMASYMAVGSATCLYYGNRMMQLPLGIFAVAISTALLPSLAGHHASDDSQAFKKTIGFGLRLTLFITLPASLGLILLSDPINLLLFRAGRFDTQAALNASAACALYSAGIVFASFNKVIGPAFYARDEAAIPVKVSLAGVAINVAVSLGLQGRMGFRALALATTLSSLAQAAALVWLLRRRMGPLLRTEIFSDFAKIAFCSLAMALAVWGSSRCLGPVESLGRGGLALRVGGLMALAAALYFPLAHALGLDYLGPLLGKRRKLA
jgi:putative peptidoglycan lipid II flippase